MENIVYDRNYEVKGERDMLTHKIFDLATAPGGYLEKLAEKLNKIPKVIIPEDKENYDYLLAQCDEFAQRHQCRIHGEVDYEHWDAHIDLYPAPCEFNTPEDMKLLRDIGEKAHYLSIEPQADGEFHIHIMINYFQDLMTDEYCDYLKFEALSEDKALSELVHVPALSEKDEAVVSLIQEILDRFEAETDIDRTTAFRVVFDHVMAEQNDTISLEHIAGMLQALLEALLQEGDTQSE